METLHTVGWVFLAVLLIGAGVGHFVKPEFFRGVIPSWIPFRPFLVVASGIAEMAVGIMFFLPDYRAFAGWGAAALITGFMVTHLDALRYMDARGPLLTRPAIVPARIVVNVGYIALAVWIASNS